MKPINILLIDDDEDDFILTKNLLQETSASKNYKLFWCSNYSEVINSILKKQYDLYLLDYRLGKYSGLDLLKEAKSSNCTEPVIILTGKGNFMIDEEALRIGAADYLVKDNLTSTNLERSIRYAIEQNKTLKSLKLSEKKFRSIFEQSKDPIIVSDFNGKIYEVNCAATLFFDTSKEELLFSNARKLYISLSERERFTTMLEENGFVKDIQLTFKTLNDELKTASASSFLQISQDGKSELIYTVIHDLSFLENQESILRSSEKTREFGARSNKLAHSIRNPLSNINLAIDELHNTLKDPEELLLLEIIKSNNERISELLTEFVNSSQLNVSDVHSMNTFDFLKRAIDK